MNRIQSLSILIWLVFALLLAQPVRAEGEAVSLTPEPQATGTVTASTSDDGTIPVTLVQQLLAEVTGQVGVIAIIALLLLAVVVLIAVVPMARWLYQSTPPVAQPILKEGLNTAGTLITDVGKSLTNSMRSNPVTWDDDLAALIDQKVAAAVKALKEVDQPEAPASQPERIMIRGFGE